MWVGVIIVITATSAKILAEVKQCTAHQFARVNLKPKTQNSHYPECGRVAAPFPGPLRIAEFKREGLFSRRRLNRNILFSKLKVEQQIIQPLQPGRHEERRGGGDRLDQKAGDGGGDGLGEASREHRDRGGRGPLRRGHERHRVGLPGGNVHLGEGHPRQIKTDRDFKSGRERHQDQEEMGEKMGRHHRFQQADPVGQAGGDEKGERRQQSGDKEEGREGLQRNVEPRIEPIGDQTLNNEAAGERIERKEEREPGDPLARERAQPLRRERRHPPLHPVAQGEGHPGRGQSEKSIEKEERLKTSDRRETDLLQPAGNAPDQRPRRGGEQPRHVVEGEEVVPFILRPGLRQDRLLDRKERPDFIAGRIHRADQRRRQKKDRMV